jgi:hypothetical protein
VYVGFGEKAEQAAAEDARRRAEIKSCRTEKNRLRDLDSSVRRMTAQIESLARAVLYMHDYHRHHRSEWRKRYGN